MFVNRMNTINNAYNPRQDLLAERFVRGKIYARGGEVLAETVTDSQGVETRKYPYNELFSHVVGRFHKGKTGIELSENFTLLSSNTNIFSQAYTHIEGEKVLADNIVTTLDVNLQKIAYDALGNYKGAVVVTEPSTGKILAMVSKPSYNPNTVIDNWDSLTEDANNNSTLLNRATQGLYAPGSTFKIVTLLEYLREHKDYNKFSYDCNGHQEFGSDIRINCYGGTHHGKLDLKHALAKSCNSAFSYMGSILDLKSYRKTADGILFNQPIPGFQVYNTSRFVLNENSDKEEVVQTAMGQGKTQMTPYHNALLISAIANGGTLMKPYVVDRVETSTGNVVRSTKQKEYKKLMSEEESAILTDYMTEVVKSGTGTGLKNSSYQVAGKTGSAEYDSTGASHAWFIGFAPANEPKIAVSVLVEGAGTGSAYAVPIAKKIFDAYLK